MWWLKYQDNLIRIHIFIYIITIKFFIKIFKVLNSKSKAGIPKQDSTASFWAMLVSIVAKTNKKAKWGWI